MKRNIAIFRIYYLTHTANSAQIWWRFLSALQQTSIFLFCFNERWLSRYNVKHYDLVTIYHEFIFTIVGNLFFPVNTSSGQLWFRKAVLIFVRKAKSMAFLKISFDRVSPLGSALKNYLSVNALYISGRNATYLDSRSCGVGYAKNVIRYGS